MVDDGWFHGRRDDHAGLGDWWVDTSVWTEGLTPLIDHVRGLGMQFGIWVEPEMVNPDSDLYRAHPDWTLVDDRYPVVLGRNQLVLDLGRAEVGDYLFGQLDTLLRDHDIAYVKWDMNRDLVAATSAGRAGVHRQTLGCLRPVRSAARGTTRVSSSRHVHRAVVVSTSASSPAPNGPGRATRSTRSTDNRSSVAFRCCSHRS